MEAPGDYWIGACVDVIEGESLGENNCSESQQITVRNTNNCSTNVIEIEGGAASGTLGSGDCDKSPRGAAFRSESFSFDGYRGQDIVVAANWNNFDGYLYLEGPDGKIVTQNDDATSQLSAKLTQEKHGGNIMSQNVEATDNSSSEVRAVLEETGTYKVWATSYSPDTTGSFELSTGVFLACSEVLIIDSITVDKSVVSDGEQITASTQLRSDGCNDTQESLLRYFISSNSVITSGDAEVGRDVIESLPVGDSGIEHVLVEAPVTSGKYWIGACINEINDDCVVSEAIEVQSDIESIPFNSGMSDAWYNPDQAGQGILISVIPSRNLIFMAWFTFDNELPPPNTWSNLGDAGHRWMTAYGTYQGNSATLNVEWTRGGVFNSSNSPMQQSNSGTVQIQFTDCNKGTLQYDIPDIDQQGTIEIERVTRENLHLCESGITDTQQLANSVNIEIDQDQIRTGENMNLMWQAPSDLNCVSTGGNDSWADGIELDDSGSYEVRIGTEGDLEFGMHCSGGSSTQSNVRAGAHVTALNTEEDRSDKHGQKVLFNPGLNDAWYDPSLPGQGLLLTVFPDTKLVFLAWFTFDTARPPGNIPFNMGDPGHRWMTAYGYYEDDTVQLKIERTRGGVFDSVEPKVVQEDYGTLDLSFDDCNSGELIYSIPSAGLNGTIPLERVVADKVGECEAQDGFDKPVDVQKQPDAKDLLPNSCGGSYTWNFEWEEQQGFQLYEIEIRNGRSDQPVYRDSVLGTELTITKTEVITTEYLTGWSWRVRAISSTVGGPWSEDREFNVAPVTSCN